MIPTYFDVQNGLRFGMHFTPTKNLLGRQPRRIPA